MVSGDSAGGGLALALVLWLRDEGRLPGGCVLLSPWLDLGRDRRARPEPGPGGPVVLTPDWLDACARAYADPAAWTSLLVSPLRADPAGLPPLLVQARTEELLAPDAETLAASGAATAGVDVTYTRWPRMWHDFALHGQRGLRLPTARWSRRPGSSGR